MRRQGFSITVANFRRLIIKAKDLNPEFRALGARFSSHDLQKFLKSEGVKKHAREVFLEFFSNHPAIVALT
jgi:hypothetical protein